MIIIIGCSPSSMDCFCKKILQSCFHTVSATNTFSFTLIFIGVEVEVSVTATLKPGKLKSRLPAGLESIRGNDYCMTLHHYFSCL